MSAQVYRLPCSREIDALPAPPPAISSAPARRWLRLLGAAALLLGFLAPPGDAAALTFDLSEISAAGPEPVNGLGSVMGVTFEFTLAGVLSDAAEYGASPGELASGGTIFVTSPVLAGPTTADAADPDADGILRLIFDNPIMSLSFGLAMDDIFPGEGFSIDLLDSAGASVASGAVGIAVQPINNLWAEAKFCAVTGAGTPDADCTSVFALPDGGAQQAVLDFNEGALVRSAFWLDNLLFQEIEPIPEAGTAALLACGLLGLALAGRRGRA